MKKRMLDLVAGARPNFMKIAPVYFALARTDAPFKPRIIHTGQHYDPILSDVFFADLGLPAPEHHLGVGSGTVAAQTGRVMEAYDRVLQDAAPAMTMVVGDVNSTVGCGLAAAHRGVPLVHLEAGLRSFDRTMPEELNRVITDQISDLLLTPSADADANLRAEGIAPEKIRLVGNIMIDSLEAHLERAKASPILSKLGVQPSGYGLCTLHRPANVDDAELLGRLLATLGGLSQRLPILLPVHPRLRKQIEQLDSRLRKAFDQEPGLRLIDPLGYVDFLALERSARLVLTDSGGVQEETTVLGVPCLTLRENSERPVTIAQGSNRLVGRDEARITAAFEEVLALPPPAPKRLPLWDGRTAGRVVEALQHFFQEPAGKAGHESGRRPITRCAIPECEAHRSPEVRRELLLVAETGDWQSAPELRLLTERIRAYTRAPEVTLCGDVPGGLAALRAHVGSGPVAVLGGSVPEDVAGVLNSSAAAWPSLNEALPAGSRLVYIPPFEGPDYRAPDSDAVAAWAGRFPGVRVAVDERWFEYSGRTVAGALAGTPNLIALRSLAPAFGLDGLGAGYLLSAQGALEASVAAAASAGLLPVARRAMAVALLDQGYMREYVETRLATRRWLKTALEQMGFAVRELPGPHLFVVGPMPGVLRDAPCTLASGSGWLWAVGTPEQVEDLLSRLEAAAHKSS